MSKKVETALKAAHTIRRENLLLLVGEGRRFATQVELAGALDIGTSYLSQMLIDKPVRRISETSARKFEYKLGLTTGALDRAA